jgi:hypothetical protein
VSKGTSLWLVKLSETFFKNIVKWAYLNEPETKQQSPEGEESIAVIRTRESPPSSLQNQCGTYQFFSSKIVRDIFYEDSHKTKV